MANTSKKPHPSMGGSPKAGKGKCGPGMGTMPGGVNNTRGISATAPSGGKVHPSVGGDVPRVKNPAPVSYNTVGGKPAKVKGW